MTKKSKITPVPTVFLWRHYQLINHHKILPLKEYCRHRCNFRFFYRNYTSLELPCFCRLRNCYSSLEDHFQWRRHQAFTGGGQRNSGGGGGTCAAISTQTWTLVKNVTIYSIFDIAFGVGLGTLGGSSRNICTGSRLRCVGTLCENRKHRI